MFSDFKQSNQPMDFIAFEIFQRILGSIFNASDGKSISSVDFRKINEDRIIFLFTWPLIIARRYLDPFLELSLFKKQCELNSLLSNNFEAYEIVRCLSAFDINNMEKNSNQYDTITDPDIPVDSLNEKTLSDFFSEVFEKFQKDMNQKNILEKSKNMSMGALYDLLIGGKPNSKKNVFDQNLKLANKFTFITFIESIIHSQSTGNKIRNGLFYYYMLLSIFISNIGNKNVEYGVDLKDIMETFTEYSYVHDSKLERIINDCIQLFIVLGSHKFTDTTKFFSQDYTTNFKSFDLNKDNYYYEYQLVNGFPKYICSIAKTTNKDNKRLNHFEVDVTREITIFDDMNYSLEFSFKKNLLTNMYSDYIEFKIDKDEPTIQQLIHCMSKLAHKLSIHIHTYMSKYNDFVSNTAICVDQNLERFLDQIDTIQNSYYLFNEYLEHKDFSRAIENLDMELKDGDINKARNAIKKIRKNHLSPKLIRDLLEANNEVYILFNYVQRKDDIERTKLAKDFFKRNPHYFRILKYNDIKHVEFTKDPNAIRNARRQIFYNIAARAGKDISGSKITKELSFE
ncbi:hypothetical protein KQH27_00375 [bacterium]|nr:hypothetical protein [bacterium]